MRGKEKAPGCGTFLHRTPGFVILFFRRSQLTVSVAEVDVTLPMLLVTTQRYRMPL